MNNFKYNKNEIGVDEAGRGPFFGPVFAAAVVWGDAPDNELIKDSKKLSEKKRKLALEWIVNNVKSYGVGHCSAEEIDNYGILNATKIAMDRAVNNLSNIKSNNMILIDGIGWEQKEFNFTNKVESIVKGDSKYRNIAAASILAKEYHDMKIKDICENNSELNIKYDLLKNKGYGTKKHIEGIKLHGFSEFHRKSFNIKSFSKCE